LGIWLGKKVLSMSAEAIQRIRNEMDSEKNNPNIRVIGEFMIQYVGQNPGAADKVCTNGKFLTGAYKAIEDYAKKKPRNGNCVAVAPDEGFEQVLKYFGIDHKADPVIQSRFLQGEAAADPAGAEHESVNSVKSPADDLDLSNFL
jgi:hypothetical protein